MRKNLMRAESWAVYKMPINLKGEGQHVVCEQHEWESIESAQPGVHTLIQARISNEGEAERLARGTSGDSKPRRSRSAAREFGVHVGGIAEAVN